MKVLVEFEGVLDVVCVEENKISWMKLYYITSTKRAGIKLDGRTNSTVSTVRSMTERFSGMRGGRPRKYLIRICAVGGLCNSLQVVQLEGPQS
jgi:hypothetical protein